ncbi:MAG: S8 family serine peptidase [Bacteroidia bacterium]|nr:S8 family serine peptidase [Bacteroidia bacterium]
MNKRVGIIIFLLIFGGRFYAQTTPDYTKTSDLLLEKMDESPEGYLRFSIRLADRADIRSLDANFRKKNTPLGQRARTVISTLKTYAVATQGDLRDFLEQSPDVLPGSIKSYWITNILYVTAKPSLIVELSHRMDVDWLEFDYPIALVEPDSRVTLSGSGVTESVGGVEPGLQAINAPAMWALGYTGYGRKTLTVDTGADPTHPAIAGRYWGNFVPKNLAWFDPNTGSEDPFDCDSHGSHVTGTMLGLDPATHDTIGVAPEAVWMASAAICDNGSEDNLSVMQWAIDPDGDSTTTWDMPDAMNCSWWAPDIHPECNSDYVEVLNALEAAGIAVVFAAGNFGPAPSSVTIPQDISTDLVNTFSVGAVNGNVPTTPIVGFSARGPSNCGTAGSLLIKPEVAAPGLDVRSSILGGGYGLFSGTSMASPHAAGAILLLKQAFPYLSGTDLKLALYFSAIDMGEPGEDNSYGMGLIDVYAAYNYLITLGNTPVSPNASFDVAAQMLVNLDTFFCGATTVSPLVLVKNEGDSVVNTMKIVLSYFAGQQDTILWSGVIPPGTLQLIALPSQLLPGGDYNFSLELILPNGNEDVRFLDNRLLRNVTVTADPAIAPVSTSVCKNANAYIIVASQNPWQTFWYNEISGGAPFFEGNSYLTPTLDTSRVYYVGNGLQGSLGLPDSLGENGFYDTNNVGYMTFDCSEDIILKSVKVYSNNVGVRLFQVTDAGGNLIEGKIVQMLDGEHNIELGFEIPAGNGYKLHYLGLWGMYRQSAGATYPYNLDGLVTITGSEGGDSAYAYFYDWQIQVNGSCPRTPITVSTIQGTMNAAFAATPGLVQLPNQTGDVQFTDLSANALTWKWNFGDGGTSTLQNPQHTYSLVGEYPVSLTASGADGCTDTFIDTVIVKGWNTSIEDFEAGNEGLTIYPNPSGGILNLKFDFDKPEEVEIYTTDMMGKIVQYTGKKVVYTDNILMDVSGISAGVYLLHVKKRSTTLSRKLLKVD